MYIDLDLLFSQIADYYFYNLINNDHIQDPIRQEMIKRINRIRYLFATRNITFDEAINLISTHDGGPVK